MGLNNLFHGAAEYADPQAGVSHAGVADSIGKSLSGQIDSIQVCPGGIIRVSFLDPQSKRSYEEAGSISFDDVSCQVLCSTPVTHVLVYLFPFEGSNDHVQEALKYFGEIKEVKFQQWTNVPGGKPIFLCLFPADFLGLLCMAWVFPFLVWQVIPLINNYCYYL